MLAADGVDTTGMLTRLAALAARIAGVSTAVIEAGAIRAAFNEIPAPTRFQVVLPFEAKASSPGTLTLSDARRHAPLTPSQHDGLANLLQLVRTQLDHGRHALHLQAVNERAARADHILSLVAEATSCADALTGLLGELCRHHDAVVGRIWRLLHDGTMEQVSRFNDPRLPAASYYQVPPNAPVHAGNSWTAQAIARNQPEAFIYADVEHPERYALLQNAIDAGLASQVSFPFWIRENRFGVSLAFSTARPDLDAIVADIAALANTIRPVLHRKATDERVQHLALHDDLTQLGNRAAFNARLRTRLADAAAGGEPVTLLYLDLDGFKQVNDMHGHAAGDAILSEAAQRLRTATRDVDIIARLGGDEFAILQAATPIRPDAAGPHPGGAGPGGAGPGDASPGDPEDPDLDETAPAPAGMVLARRLLDRFAVPFALGGPLHVTVGTSIGIATFPHDGDTPDTLLRSADAALYEAKRAGRNTVRTFDRQLDQHHRARTVLRHELEAAIGNNALRLAFQPICELPGRSIHSQEALLRWHHPHRGAIPPHDVIPIAEAAGLSLQLTQWVLQAACTAATTWPGTWRIAVNLSPHHVRQPGLPARVAAILAAAALPAHRLSLEVTEELLVDRDPTVLNTLQSLKDLGVSLILDDFGALHAGLAWLPRIGFDQIKLGRTLTAALPHDAATQAIVDAILTFAARLGIGVVAEGVETDMELDTVQRAGVRFAQGFLLGRPGSVVMPPRLEPARC